MKQLEKVEIPIKKIKIDPDQPRQTFDKESMLELKHSIRKQGILNSLFLESNYEGDNYLILDGERRYRCAVELNLKTLPSEITKGPLTHIERTVKRFHIQEQRKSWNDYDRAKAISQFKKASKFTLAKIADVLNLHLPKVHGLLSITEFSEKGQKLLVENKIPISHAVFLIRIVRDFQTLFPKTSKEEIEEKLINKVLTEKLKSNEINIFSQIMAASENERDKKKYLLDNNFSFDNLTKSTKEGKRKSIEEFYKTINQANQAIIDFISKDNEMNEIVKTEVEKLKILINKL